MNLNTGEGRLTRATRMPVTLNQTSKIWGRSNPQIYAWQRKRKFSLAKGTPYHKFIIAEGYTGRSRVVPASELKDGDKLIKHELPVIKDGEDFRRAPQTGEN